MKNKLKNTYEDLLNDSDLLRFFKSKPQKSKNELLYKIMNPFLVFLLLVVGITWAGYKIGMSAQASFAIAICSAMCVIVINNRMYNTMAGHGVGLQKQDNVISWMGLSDQLSIICTVFLVTSLLAVVLSNFVLDHDDVGTYFNLLGFRFVSGSLLISIVFLLLSWKYHIYYATFHGSAYEARREFAEKGIDRAKIEKYLAILHEHKIIE